MGESMVQDMKVVAYVSFSALVCDFNCTCVVHERAHGGIGADDLQVFKESEET